MNIKLLVFITSCLFLFQGCSNDKEKEIPECLRETRDAVLEKPVQTPRAKFEKWRYKGEEVYLISAQNFPDGQDFVITLDCSTTVCTLGGFDGSDNDCPDWDQAEYIETIWQDSR